MKLPIELWATICILTIIIIGTVTSKSFWSIIKRKCKECKGDGIIHFDDANGGFWEYCEHCKQY